MGSFSGGADVRKVKNAKQTYELKELDDKLNNIGKARLESLKAKHASLMAPSGY